MDETLHGKSIKSLWWSGANGDTSIVADSANTLTLFHKYCGDRDEYWVIHTRDGKEFARHNCRQIATIEWA